MKEYAWAIVNSRNDLIKVFTEEEASSSFDAISEARDYILDSIMEAKAKDPGATLPTEEAFRVVHAPLDDDGRLKIDEATEEIEL